MGIELRINVVLPRKLEPVAMLCQAKSLYNLTANFSSSHNEAGSSANFIQGLRAAQEEESIRVIEVEATAALLQETCLKLEAAFDKMRAEDAKAEDVLSTAYIAVSKETMRLLHEGALVNKYAWKAAEMEVLSA